MKNWLNSLIERAYDRLTRELRDEFDRKAKKAADEVWERFDGFIKQYSYSRCSRCGKDILAHYGGFYRNSKGHVFCSGACIGAPTNLTPKE